MKVLRMSLAEAQTRSPRARSASTAPISCAQEFPCDVVADMRSSICRGLQVALRPPPGLASGSRSALARPPRQGSSHGQWLSAGPEPPLPRSAQHRPTSQAEQQDVEPQSKSV